MQRYFSTISPIFLDGCIAVLIAMMTAISMNIAQDDASKYLSGQLRWWMIVVIGSLTQGLHALSKFRDQTFSRHLDVVKVREDEQKQIDREDRAEKKKKGDTDFLKHTSV